MHDYIGCYECLDEHPCLRIHRRHKVFFDAAADEARKSVLSHCHGCVIVDNHRIVARGHNHGNRHAEIDALVNLARQLPRHTWTQFDMYVVRISTQFEACLKYSKPCRSCRNVILSSRIKRVFYSTNYDFEARAMDAGLTTLSFRNSAHSNSREILQPDTR